jgi:YjbE family integral membrane protein
MTHGLDANFLASVLSIILIDLVLAGDNAVVIALAVKNLPPVRRRQGILLGAGAAVALRVVATFFVAQLLSVPFLKLVGGAAVLWIGTKLFIDGSPQDASHPPATTMWQAIRLIVIADITLSIDNMLAVGGASHGDLFLLIFGLAVSVPFVVLTSNLLSILMDRYPVLIALGAAILGKVGMEMVITDPFVQQWLHVGPVGEYALQAVGAIGVLAIGQWLKRRGRAAGTNSADAVES